MSDQFLHGVELVEATTGVRPIQTLKSSVIGLVGTADAADASVFPLNTPIAIYGNDTSLLGKLGASGTLANAIDLLTKQAGGVMVVVRVDGSGSATATQTNIIGKVNTDGSPTGLKALRAAKTLLGLEPRVIIAPGFAAVQAVATEMIAVADYLRGIAIIDCPAGSVANAKTYRGNFGSARAYVVYPQVKVSRDGSIVNEPASSVVAGLIAKRDNEQGFWWSPSNQTINGIVGLSHSVDFTLGNTANSANVLNEDNVNTIIRENGFRLWGNHSCSTDEKWRFINHRRTADLIGDSIQRAHMWAVDNNINQNLVGNVVDSVNAYLRTLVNLGAIIGGECWANAELNTPVNLAAGKLYIDFDFTPPSPAEHIRFTSIKVIDYYSEILQVA